MNAAPQGRPLRVAVIGAGPAGLYAADVLTFDRDDVKVDVIERLPVPFGLLRYGVAPDHPTIKLAADTLQEVIERPAVTLFCGVEIGSTISADEVRSAYDAVVWATGADADRSLDITGESLAGSASATSFVKWYNAHPEATDIDLAGVRTAVVVGAGNVALDVSRILLKDAQELATTDMPEHVLRALESSQVRDVHLLSRRGPQFAKFSTKELSELGQLSGVDVVVDPAEVDVDPGDEVSPAAKRALGILKEWAQRPRTGARRRVHLHFGAVPEEIIGPDRVRGVRVRSHRPDGSENIDVFEAELMLRAVGYRSRPIDGVPFAAETHTIPHEEHRVVREGVPIVGEYAVGWVKRGPTGILGRNRADANQTITALLADRDVLLAAREETPAGIGPILEREAVTALDLDAWNAICAREVALGQSLGRDRVKIHQWDVLLDVHRPHAFASTSFQEDQS